MKDIYSKVEISEKLKKYAKDYKINLENKKLLFVVENKNRTLSIFEVAMLPRNFKHLTGIELIENGKRVNSNEFYKRCLKGNINASKIILKDSTSYYKLGILPQLLNIDKMAKMIGQYDNSRIYLQTDKIIGNVNACMGFVKEKNTYVPNTALNEDIRSITSERKKVIAVLKKNINEEFYKEITYLKNNYDVSQLLKYENIEKIVDFQNLTSNDRQILIKILDFDEKLQKLQKIIEESNEYNNNEEDEIE